MRRNAKTHRPMSTMLAVAVAVLFMGLAGAGAADDEIVSLPGCQAGAPSLAASGLGHGVVAWTARHLHLPAWRVCAARRHDGAWQKAEPLCDYRADVRVSDPQAALDPEGSPWVLWAAGDATHSWLEYAFRFAGRWVGPMQLGEKTSGRIERPALLVDRRGALFAAWQEREGSLYRIRAAHIDPSGHYRQWTVAGDRAPRYAIYPELLKIDHPPDRPDRIALAWYDLESERPALRLRYWDGPGRQWIEADAPALPLGTLASLPVLTRFADTGLVLAGYDVAQNDDRVYVTGATLGKRYLPGKAGEQDRFPRLSPASGRRAGLVYLRQGIETAALAPAALSAQAGFAALDEIPIDPFMPPRPDVALCGDRLIVAWNGPGRRQAASPIGGGAPVAAVLLREMPIPEDRWSPLPPAPTGP